MIGPLFLPPLSACPPLAIGTIHVSLLLLIIRWTSMVLERLRVPDKCSQHHLYMCIIFQNICVCPASSCYISIPPYISSSDFQLRNPFVPWMGGGSLTYRPLYRLLFLYSHILPYQFLFRILYFFQYIIKYHIKYCNGYWLPFFVLQYVSVVGAFLSQVYHQQYYPFYSLYTWICGRHYWDQMIISPISPLNLPNKPMMMYDPTSPSFSWPVANFSVLWRSVNKISCPLNDQSITITKAALVMTYSSCFHPSWTRSHSSNTLSSSKRTDTLIDKFLLVTYPIIFRHPRENISNHSNLVGYLDRLPERVPFPIYLKFIAPSIDDP